MNKPVNLLTLSYLTVDSIRECGLSYWKDAWLRFCQNRLAMCGLILLTVFIAMAIVVPILSPYTYYETSLCVKNISPCKALKFGKYNEKMYSTLCTHHPIDLTRYQVANNYMGRMGLINSGGASGSNDLADVVETAIINKRAGGMGLISGRKAFQKSMKEGVKLLQALQAVYLCKEISIA